MKKKQSPKFSEYLTVSQAALYLGVTATTMRNWDREGKLIAMRHPLNCYRLYKRMDLDKLRQQVSAHVSRNVLSI